MAVTSPFFIECCQWKFGWWNQSRYTSNDHYPLRWLQSSPPFVESNPLQFMAWVQNPWSLIWLYFRIINYCKSHETPRVLSSDDLLFRVSGWVWADHPLHWTKQPPPLPMFGRLGSSAAGRLICGVFIGLVSLWYACGTCCPVAFGLISIPPFHNNKLISLSKVQSSKGSIAFPSS